MTKPVRHLLRRWVSVSFVLLCALLPASPAQAQEQEQQQFALQVNQVRPHVHVLSGGPDGNVLVLVQEGAALLVDGQAVDKLSAVLSALSTVTDVPVRYVVNTHYHPDHVGANATFAERGATLISHRACREEMGRRSEVAALGWTIEAAPPEALPQLTYEGRLRLRLGEEVVDLHHMPAAHTAGDTVVHLKTANVIHTGDLFEVGGYPFLDIWHGGSLPGLVSAMDRLLELSDEETRFVPGHGPISSRADVVAYREMLAGALLRVQGAIDAGQHAQDFLASRPEVDFDYRWGSPKGALRLLTYAFIDLAPEDLVRTRGESQGGGTQQR